MPSFDPGDGHLLHYLDTAPDGGSGRRTVVLLHGWACHGGYFDRQVEGLSDRFRLVAPDLRGHRHSHRPGDTPDLGTLADDLRSLLEHARPDAPVLLGWSMGALVAFEFIRRHGDGGLAGLVVVDMTARVVNDADWNLGLLGGYERAQAERATELMRRDWDRWVDGFLPSVFAAEPSRDPALPDWVAGEMRDCDPAAMAALWESLAEADHRPVLATIAVPTLILRGVGSRLYGPETAAWMTRTVPNAEAAAVPRAGHAPHLERPEAFNRSLAAFVDRCG